uniref:Uncharacterized protein n=1 Tax=Anguilla anguilla TaxID=7936 RepID=A0A0E9U7G8_ANGAN
MGTEKGRVPQTRRRPPVLFIVRPPEMTTLWRMTDS